jgi:hypothetical protein
MWCLLHHAFYLIGHTRHAKWQSRGVRCIHLTSNLKCAIFHSPDRPKVCDGFKAEKLFCGNNQLEALTIMAQLEGVAVDGINP